MNFVGPPPVPDIVYAGTTITDFPDFNKLPEWVVIYRNVTIIGDTGKLGQPATSARPLANETVLLLFDPTSGSPSALRFCPARV